MKNMAINTLNYTGIVTLSQYVENKKITLAQVHNTGGTSLFNFLANCLAGHFQYTRVNWPTKIKLLTRYGDNNSYTYSSVSGFIFLRTAPEVIEKDTRECRVRYSFMIPRDLLENITDFGHLGLGLYTHGTAENEPENFAAFCELGPDLKLDKSELISASLLVDWDIVIANAGDANKVNKSVTAHTAATN